MSELLRCTTVFLITISFYFVCTAIASPATEYIKVDYEAFYNDQNYEDNRYIFVSDDGVNYYVYDQILDMITSNDSFRCLGWDPMRFSEGLAYVSDDGETKIYIDYNGIKSIDGRFADCDDFELGAAVVRSLETKKYGIIDKSGDYLLKPEYDHIKSCSFCYLDNPYSEDELCIYRDVFYDLSIENDGRTFYGLYTLKEGLVLEPVYSSIWHLENNLLYCEIVNEEGKKSGFICDLYAQTFGNVSSEDVEDISKFIDYGL